MRKLTILCLLCLIPLTGIGESWILPPTSAEIMEVTSNRHTQPDDTKAVEPFLDVEAFELVAQSDEAALYLNREYGTLRLKDRRTGYIWGAIPLTDARNLNTSWKSYAASIVAIECFDAKNNERRYGMADETVAKQYRLFNNGFDCDITFTALGVSLTVTVRLDQNRLRFHIDPSSIAEQGEYRLKSIAFMPYLGSVYEDEVPGWFLLPDGSGALMRFQKSGSYVAGYDKRIYGADGAVSTSAGAQSIGSIRPDDYVQEEAQVLLPVYGIVHGVGQNGLLCVVDDGAMYASIAATPAGLGNTRYNSIQARFEMRQKYNMSTNQSGAGAAIPQQEMNMFPLGLTVHLLCRDQADYDQMAVYYRSELALASDAPRGEASLRLETLCADVKNSFIPSETVTLTTLEQADAITKDLSAAGISPLTLVLSHFTKGNLPYEGPSTGTMAELKQLQDGLTANGGRLLLSLDPVRANKDQINLRLQAAHAMNLSPIKLTRNNSLIMYPDTYFFNPEQVERNVLQAMERYAGYSFAVDQLPSRFYGDYTTAGESHRAENARRFEGLLSTMNAGALYTPNQTAMGAAEAFLDMPLVSSQFLYETDSVPFLPIVLSGSKQLYASSLNLGAFSRDRILRMVEYGVYPSFTVTAAPSEMLADTPLADSFSTCYEDWREFILETWHYMRPAMLAAGGRPIISHTVQEPGRVCVCFDGGVTLLVNYTSSVWHTAQGAVDPHDYLVGGMTQ